MRICGSLLWGFSFYFRNMINQGLTLLDYMQQINPCFYLTKRYPIQPDSAILYKKIK
ncbi:hypothetical protein COPCOM_01045 [Coprococcus comes ATCC 27758]|uniref:Uncharacterized protein n=1 Tax=Coprococcus comes ATCC 27758 TaxID=470146 RepID=C0B7C4_9FIRM|nr:hypothetical protein COPCOM_01045 [Coprococcus comes ATCC 27758]